jgi:cell shape-determining protein MreD
MKRGLFFITIVILCIVQATVLDNFKIFGTKADLLLISMVAGSLFFITKWAFIFAIFSGILKDTFVANTFAINTFLFPLWSFFIIQLAKKISIDTNLIYALLVFIIVFLHNIIIRLIFLFYGNAVSFAVSLRIVFFQSLYTAGISLLLFKLIKRYFLKNYENKIY